MSVIVTDMGFGPDDWTEGFEGDTVVDLEPDADLQPLRDRLSALEMVRIAFPSFADGRGFSLARRLRLAGYEGRLRAKGHVLADQYAMARPFGLRRGGDRRGSRPPPARGPVARPRQLARA